MQNSSKPIRSALISVFYKDNLEPIVRKLHSEGVQLFSTGGTLRFIQELGIQVTAVEQYTGFPEILDGRVKTLHPSVFGAILARRDNTKDMQELQMHGIQTIDLVIVDLYPFEETVRSGKGEEDIIEKIDIGGISLIRAAAKNFNDTLIVSNRSEYDELLELLNAKKAHSDLSDRRKFAARAFMNTSHYDTLIFNYFNQSEAIDVFKSSILESRTLRYGENPHQQAKYYGKLDEVFEILNGKELSYNNLVDIESALQLIQEFENPAFAIIKHTNSCGLAERSSILEAYKAAYACDTSSAFGGVLAANREIDKACAEEINNLFFEVLSAPSYSPEALEILKQKKYRILLLQKPYTRSSMMFKNLLNGVLTQDIDNSSESASGFQLATNEKPDSNELADLEFAIKAVKHLKSNGIALVKNKQLIGMGCGQTSRVEALESAIKKAKLFGFDTTGAVMASEAFFPFPDCVDIAHQAGIRAIAQPGGSIKDKESVDAANANKQAMVLTGIRHFKH